MRPTSETADVDVADSDAGFESMTVEVGQISGDGDAGFGCPGNKKSDGPAVPHRVWAEERERIGVPAVYESVDFSIIYGVWHGNRLRSCAALFLRFLGFSRLLRQ